MEMDSSSSSPLRSPPDDDDIEEGQFVPDGYQSSPTDGGRYLLHHVRHAPRPRRLSLEDVLAMGRGDALPSPTPSSCDSDGTISDDDGNLSSASVFRTDPKHVVALDEAGSWAATGKRGWTGGKPAAAAAVLPLSPQSSASHSNVYADSSGSAQAVVVHQPPPALLHLAQLAQQAAAATAPPAAQPPRLVPHRADHPQHPRPPREYTCKECGKSYATNQALGGHVAGHKMRQREAEAAAAAAGMTTTPGQDGAAAFLAALRRGRRAEAPHECRKCGKVFATGVALGGHMRVHYTGAPIVPRRKNKMRCLALALEDVEAPPPPGLSLALSIKTEETLSPAPARVVRLFGIDISPQKQAPCCEQHCSGTTEEDSSLAAHQQ